MLDDNMTPLCVFCARPCPPSKFTDHVCGVDGVTYQTYCHLRQAACQQNKAIPEAYHGKCKEGATCEDIRCEGGKKCVSEPGTVRCVSCDYNCTMLRVKEDSTVCATDNRTYHSWCHMMQHACATGTLLLATKHGKCQQHEDNHTDWTGISPPNQQETGSYSPMTETYGEDFTGISLLHSSSIPGSTDYVKQTVYALNEVSNLDVTVTPTVENETETDYVVQTTTATKYDENFDVTTTQSIEKSSDYTSETPKSGIELSATTRKSSILENQSTDKSNVVASSTEKEMLFDVTAKADDSTDRYVTEGSLSPNTVTGTSN